MRAHPHLRSHWRRSLIVAGVMLVGVGLPVWAQLGEILKGGAVIILVKQFGKQIDDGINKLLSNRNMEHGQYTKVVPILSVGSGAFVGACQVVGPKQDVDRVDGVAQLELDLPGKARAKVLIPVDNVNDPANLQRVKGVAASAVIDLKLKL